MRIKNGFKRVLAILLVLILTCGSATAAELAAAPAGYDVAGGLDSAFDTAAAEELLASGEYDNEQLLVKVNAGFSPAANGWRTKELFALANGDRWLIVDVAKGADMAATMVDISRLSGVISVLPDYTVSLPDSVQVADVVAEDTVHSSAKVGEPGETKWIDQYYLYEYGIPEGWKHLTAQGYVPGAGVVVAVVDTGIDYNHPDLEANILRNAEGRIVGTSLVESEADLMDYNGHGTHVAGVVAAAKNDFGVTGVAYGAKLMPVKALGADGQGSLSAFVNGMVWAVQNGADIINMSLGGMTINDIGSDVFDYAAAAEVLVICAAGNSAAPNAPVGGELYMGGTLAEYHEVIGVMATAASAATNGDRLADYSNWDAGQNGDWVYDVMAPGSAIVSTHLRNGYRTMNGTSMACPVVTGMAACLLAELKAENGGTMTAADMRSVVYGQIAGCDVEQGLTVSGVRYDYPQADLYQILTKKSEPHLELIESSRMLIEGIYDEVELTFYNHYGYLDDIDVKLETSMSGVELEVLSEVPKSINGADSFNLVVGVKSRSAWSHYGTVSFGVTVTGSDGNAPQAPRRYKFAEQVSVEYYRAEMLTQDRLMELDELDDSRIWFINSRLYIPEEKKLVIGEHAELVFANYQAGINVFGELEVKGTPSDPARFYTWGLYVDIKEKDDGVVNMSYAVIDAPDIVASVMDHVTLQDCSYECQLTCDKLVYSNISAIDLNIDADKVEFCEFNDFLGTLTVRRLENSVLAPDFKLYTNGTLVLPELDVSYEMTMQALWPKLYEGEVYISLPCGAAADDEYFIEFMESYVRLIGGTLAKNWRTDAVANGKFLGDYQVRVDMYAPSQAFLDAVWQNKVLGNGMYYGFSEPFYRLLQNLNGFKNNAVLGSVEFIGGAEGQTRLLMDNYWDVTNGQFVMQVGDMEQYQDILQKYDEKNELFARLGSRALAAGLNNPPQDIPPFQTGQKMELAEEDGSRLMRGNDRYLLTVDYNTAVKHNSLVSFYTEGSSLYADAEISGSWRSTNNGSSQWQGYVYAGGYSFEDVLGNVAWAKDPWLTTGGGSRFSEDLRSNLVVTDSKGYANAETIWVKMRAMADDRLAGGLYLYRQEYGQDEITLVAAEPVLGNKNWFGWQDDTAEPGKLYVYGISHKADAKAEDINFKLQMALKAEPQFEFAKAADGNKQKVSISAAEAFYVAGGTEYTFKLYYDGSLKPHSLAEAANNGSRTLLGYAKGRDEKGNYMLLRLASAYDCSWGSGELCAVWFTGSGEVRLAEQ